MNCSSVMLTVTIVASLVMLTSSATQFYASGRYGKRTEYSSGPMFWTGSRYGRSNGGGGTVAALPGGGRFGDTVEVAARNERFFGGSRYGKRGVEQQAAIPDSPSDVLAVEDETSQVTCLYTGVTNLYRCYNRKENSSEESVSSRRAK